MDLSNYNTSKLNSFKMEGMGIESDSCDSGGEEDVIEELIEENGSSTDQD